MLCNDFLPLQTFDKLNLFIRHLKTKLVYLKYQPQPKSGIVNLNSTLVARSR